MYSTDARTEISRLTRKQHIWFVDRGNKAIIYAVRCAHSLGMGKLYSPDEGGWITYKQSAKKAQMAYELINSKQGIISAQQLPDKEAVIMNVVPGYAYGYTVKEMERMINYASKKKTLIISDVTGALGLDIAQYGDILVGSFGKHKPAGIGEGGFIATDRDDVAATIKTWITEPEIDYDLLASRLNRAEDIQKWYIKEQQRVKQDLTEMDILHPERHGINVIIACEGSKQEKVIEYCKANGFEYTVTPRYIRTMTPGISIELKRRLIS